MDPKPEWHCRIGRVTRKGGATVRVLRPENDGSPVNVIQRLHEHVGDLVGTFKEDAAGFVVVMWDRAGRYSRGSYKTPSSPFGYRTMPDIVRGILAQDVMAEVTRGVLRGDE